MAEPAVRAEGLTKFYGRRRGIVGLDLEVREGEAFGVLGPAGAGKSTLLRILCNLVFPTYGTAEVFGLDCVLDAARVREYVGYAPAAAASWPGWTAGDLFRWAAASYRLDDPERAWTLSERLGLDTERRLDDPSWDGARKAAVVQALLHEPGLLLLDEPFLGLDTAGRAALEGILAEESAQGVTLVLAGADLEAARVLCHRTAVLREGRVVAVEDSAALGRRDLLRVRLETARELSAADFPSGRADGFLREGRAVSFLYAGDGALLARELSPLEPRRLLVAEADLEEVIARFYPRERSA